MPAQAADWWFCVGLTAVGAVGLTCHELAAFLGGSSSKHVEVPFGTFINLAEHVGGIVLAWHWFGAAAAVVVFIVGSLCAFALTFVFGGRYQSIWFLGQATFLLWGALLLEPFLRGLL